MGGFKSFKEKLNTRGWITVDIEGFGDMADGHTPQFRCLPFGSADWLDPEYKQYRGIPVLSGGKSELDEEDMVDFWNFAIVVIKKAVRFSREIDAEGKVVWEPCRITTDSDQAEPYLEGDLLQVPLCFIDTNDNVMNIAAAILRDSNSGGRMAELEPAGGFRAEGTGSVRTPGKADEVGPARAAPKPKRRAGRVG